MCKLAVRYSEISSKIAVETIDQTWTNYKDKHSKINELVVTRFNTSLRVRQVHAELSLFITIESCLNRYDIIY